MCTRAKARHGKNHLINIPMQIHYMRCDIAKPKKLINSITVYKAYDNNQDSEDTPTNHHSKIPCPIST